MSALTVSDDRPDSCIRSCPHCGAANRIPARHLAHSGRCGACRGSLQPISEPIDADAALFQAITADAAVPVMVDFWAPWCGPCRAVAPELLTFAQESAGQALVLKVNVDAQPSLAAQFRIESIPTFCVFEAGELVMRQSGAVRREQMRQWLASTLARRAATARA